MTRVYLVVQLGWGLRHPDNRGQSHQAASVLTPAPRRLI